MRPESTAEWRWGVVGFFAAGGALALLLAGLVTLLGTDESTRALVQALWAGALADSFLAAFALGKRYRASLRVGLPGQIVS